MINIPKWQSPLTLFICNNSTCYQVWACNLSETILTWVFVRYASSNKLIVDIPVGIKLLRGCVLESLSKNLRKEGDKTKSYARKRKLIVFVGCIDLKDFKSPDVILDCIFVWL